MNPRRIRTTPFTSRRLTAALGAAALLCATACGSESTSTADGSDNSSDGAAGGDRPTIVVGSYPAEYLAQRLAGNLASISSLAKPGAEAHHVELHPDDVIAIADADLVVTIGGFQHAVDEAVSEASPESVVDLAESIDLLTRHDSEAIDYHFWLDTDRYLAAADALSASLIELLPDSSEAIGANLDALRDDLTSLDERFSSGLASCASRTIVTGHEAFGYLADRYDLTEHGIHGLAHDHEPSPNDIAELVDLVRDEGVTTVFFETLTSSDLATTIADDAGVGTDVLDPIEGLSDHSRGADYLEIMNANLDALRSGLGCS